VLPPVLEVYVLWHPGDSEGAALAAALLDHFHGTVFTGLMGGAVEVYIRSAGWSSACGSPRPVPFPGRETPGGLSTARFVVVVPAVGHELAAAVEPPGAWRDYLTDLRSARDADRAHVGVFPVVLDTEALPGTHLGRILGSLQAIAYTGTPGGDADQAGWCRDLVQAIAQLADPDHSRVTVFISHTKWAGTHEQGAEGLVRQVRAVLSGTRMADFFDARDLQPGEDWSHDLQDNAAHGALLALRTDLYASRVWCQREMLIAKRKGVPVVILDALDQGEERGSFLMDHVPRIPVRSEGGERWREADVHRGLDLLVDEHLKRVLWQRQQEVAQQRPDLDIDWWAPHAPEPVTLTEWLTNWRAGGASPGICTLRVLHPDPPLGADERAVLDEVAAFVGLSEGLDLMTPRQLAARGA
jgi:hypothetical protein